MSRTLLIARQDMGKPPDDQHRTAFFAALMGDLIVRQRPVAQELRPRVRLYLRVLQTDL